MSRRWVSYCQLSGRASAGGAASLRSLQRGQEGTSLGFTQLHATLFLGQGGCETPGVPWGSRGWDFGSSEACHLCREAEPAGYLSWQALLVS